jgi:hypothetical protein
MDTSQRQGRPAHYVVGTKPTDTEKAEKKSKSEERSCRWIERGSPGEQEESLSHLELRPGEIARGK